MNISVIGTGYIGLITGVGFAERGHMVKCVDVIKEKVDLINKGVPTIYEKGLRDMLEKNLARLTATTDIKEAVLNSEITFICVGTPPGEDGASDLKYIREASEQIGTALSKKDSYHIVIVKSTVIPGTTEDVVKPIIEKFSGKKAGAEFGVAMNPEFLKEGVALEDFFNPDRIVIGSIDEKSGDIIEKLYSGFDSRILRTNIKTAEMIKYASNSFLATKISFINEVGNICKELGIDAYDVAEGMSLDHRISPHFLNAGLGWGGSCFPKDVKALIHKARKSGYEPTLLDAALMLNSIQPQRLLNIAIKKAGTLRGKRICVLGLAFKSGTDDVRDSQAFPVIEGLIEEGASVVAYDPKAEENARRILGDRIEYAESIKDALKDSDMALIVTEWPEFKEPDFSQMKQKVVIDARNIVKNRDGVEYEGLCW